MSKNSVELSYYSISRDRVSKRIIDPYKIWFIEGGIYLIGYCHNRKEVRTFLVDRIRAIKKTDLKFEIIKGFSFEDYIKDAFRVIRDELVEVKVRFDKIVAPTILEKIWHPSQRIKKNRDGSLDVTFQVGGIQEIKFWILSFGSTARVLKPDSLKELIKKELLASINNY